MNAAIVDTDVVSMLFKGDSRALEYRRHIFSAKRKGRPIQTADAWIAASALYYQVPLITNNQSDYSMVDGLVVLSAQDRS